MLIKELANKTNVTSKTIRYYESVGLLPPAKRLPNGYRDYGEADLTRLRFVAGARQLGFSLDDIGEILSLREKGEPPCRAVLDMLEQKAAEIQDRIRELERLEQELRELRQAAAEFPIEDIDGKHCVCHLVRNQSGRES